ncbi:ABC-2 family transporter domain containing protein [Nitzschia inconspicua]|uniref:ABC-2 family transporter domain containing protein n=1 Tax=Nitzschia inconspicua TaxID=303405 RepID=A0A9K3LRU0_9STRA|nr:ABC-2 family transporter domain containing protein [Nitzschia inconspicua]
MIGSRAWFALMRRDLIYRRRNIIGTLFEFFLPIAFVGFLVLIKNAVEDSESFAPVTVPDTFPDNSDSLILFSFTDYVTTLQAERKCVASPSIPWRSSSQGSDSSLSITGIFNKGYNWQVPFVKCDSRLCREDGQDALPFCEFLALGVAPSSEDDTVGLEQAEAFRDYIYNEYPVLLDSDAMPFDFEFVQMFESDQAVEQFVQSKNYGDDFKLAISVVFDGTSDPTINYNYKLRVNSTGFNSPEDQGRPATTTTPPTDQLFETFAQTDSESCPNLVGGTPDMGPYSQSCTGRYIYNGALTIQRLVHDFIISESGARGNGYYVAENGVQFVAFPFKSYVENGFYAQINAFAPLLITLGLLYPVAAIIRYIVLEKELRQKELMKMMSIKESDIGWSWFTFFFVFHAITALGTALVSTRLYDASSPLLLFIFWEFTFLAIICFSFFLASLFSKATRATLVSLLVFFVGYFLTLVVNYQTSSVGLIFLVALHPVGAFAFGLQEIGRLEDLGVGLTFDTITQTDSPNGYTFANTMSSFLFDALLWGVVSWYLNRVARAEYGRPLPWYFPFTLSYWCPGSSHVPAEAEEEIEYPLMSP